MVILPSYITASEKTESIIPLIRSKQRKRYSEEIQTLGTAQQVKPKSQICELCPFLHNGFLCVGGRLVHTKLPAESKLQILFLQDYHIAHLVVFYSHQLTHHGGTSQTIAHIKTCSGFPVVEVWLKK